MDYALRYARCCILMMALLAIVSVADAATSTIVEDYTYNPDGALTAITTTIGNGQPETT